jgi:hypothetical protein
MTISFIHLSFSNVTYLKYCNKNIVTKGKKGKFVTLSGKKVTKGVKSNLKS